MVLHGVISPREAAVRFRQEATRILRFQWTYLELSSCRYSLVGANEINIYFGGNLVTAKRKTRKLREYNNFAGYVFISPWLFGFLFVTIIPIFMSLYLSFTKYDILLLEMGRLFRTTALSPISWPLSGIFGIKIIFWSVSGNQLGSNVCHVSCFVNTGPYSICSFSKIFSGRY